MPNSLKGSVNKVGKGGGVRGNVGPNLVSVRASNA